MPWILKDLNFKMNSKEKIALVGASGSGKSTLAKIILWIYSCYKKVTKITGVLEVGLFINMCNAIIVGYGKNAKVIENN